MRIFSLFTNNYDDEIYAKIRIAKSTNAGRTALYYIYERVKKGGTLDNNELRAVLNHRIWREFFVGNCLFLFHAQKGKTRSNNIDLLEKIMFLALEHSEYFNWEDYLDFEKLNMQAIFEWEENKMIETRDIYTEAIRFIEPEVTDN